MAELKNIVTGWGKSMGLLEVSKAEREMSMRRMEICAGCPNAKKSAILMLMKGKNHNMGAIYCNLCKCPVNEKSLVKEEKCPAEKWEDKNGS